jgi:hypothetical protein
MATYLQIKKHYGFYTVNAWLLNWSYILFFRN